MEKFAVSSQHDQTQTQTESKNCSVKRGQKANHTRKSERPKKSSPGWITETIQEGGEQQVAQVRSRLCCPSLKILNTVLSTGNISMMHKSALPTREQSIPRMAQHYLIKPGSSARCFAERGGSAQEAVQPRLVGQLSAGEDFLPVNLSC